MENHTPLSLILDEAKSLVEIPDLERLVETPQQIKHLPLQPLYMACRNSSLEQVSQLLPLLSEEQRGAMRDNDLWLKDELDIEQFPFWLAAYSQCKDQDVRQEMARSSQFLLYLKGLFTVSTLDQDEPEYPEHEHFFVTEDNLLVFEYEEKYPFVEEVQGLISELYSEMGVEGAYTLLFKMVADSFFERLEDEYRFKKGRLDDYGLPDYYDALERLSPFASFQKMDQFILTKTAVTGRLDGLSKGQALHEKAIRPYRNKLDGLNHELGKIPQGERFDYLQFNFIKTVNSSIIISNALKRGALALTETGSESVYFFQLGFSYLKFLRQEKSLFDYFDFHDLYRIGKTCVTLIRKMTKDDSFFGHSFEQSFNGALMTPMKGRAWFSEKEVEIKSYEDLMLLKDRLELAQNLSQYVLVLKKSFDQLKQEGKLSDSFYLNYNVDQIDFESIIISSFANFCLGHKSDEKKLGLTVTEFKHFVKLVCQTDSPSSLMNFEELGEKYKDFSRGFELDQVPFFFHYLHEILNSNLEGYEFNKLRTEEFSHVGGPILLNS